MKNDYNTMNNAEVATSYADELQSVANKIRESILPLKNNPEFYSKHKEEIDDALAKADEIDEKLRSKKEELNTIKEREKLQIEKDKLIKTKENKEARIDEIMNDLVDKYPTATSEEKKIIDNEFDSIKPANKAIKS